MSHPGVTDIFFIRDGAKSRVKGAWMTEMNPDF